MRPVPVIGPHLGADQDLYVFQLAALGLMLVACIVFLIANYRLSRKYKRDK